MKFFKNILIIFFSLILFFFVILGINYKAFTFIDLKINEFISSYENSFTFFLSNIVSFFFNTEFIIFLTLIICIYLWNKKKNESIFFAISISLTALTIFIFKILIQRPRPFNALVSETDFSFPSGHSIISVVFLGLINYLFLEKTKSYSFRLTLLSLSIFIVFLVFLSRLFLNVHWFTDILGGFFLGIFLLTTFITLFENFKKRN